MQKKDFLYQIPEFNSIFLPDQRKKCLDVILTQLKSLKFFQRPIQYEIFINPANTNHVAVKSEKTHHYR